MISRRALLALAILVWSAVTFHAGMVFFVNAPGNPIKKAIDPIIAGYRGPQLSQGWTIFAPNPPQANINVLVRGRTSDGRVTGWFDTSLFFLDLVGQNRLNPIRELGEGLGHAALTSSRWTDNRVSHAYVLRTAAMVLKLYVHKPLVSEQIELDIWNIKTSPKKTVSFARWSWEPLPDVDAIHM